MATLVDLLAPVFERKGYLVQRAGEAGPLLAVSGGAKLIVHWCLDAPVTPEDLAQYAAEVRTAQGNAGVLVALAGTAPGAESAAASQGVELWSKARAAFEIGDALLAAGLDAAAEPAATREPPPPPAAPPHVHAAASSPPAHAPAHARFPSLVAQAAAVASGSGSNAVYLPGRPKKAPEASPSDAGRPLAYAWGASAAAATSPTPSGIAQVRKGRKKPVEAPVAPPTPVEIAPESDVEITTAPRKKRAPAAPPVVTEAPPPAPAPAPATTAPPAPGEKALWPQLAQAKHAPAPRPPAPEAAPPVPAVPATPPPPDPSWLTPAPPQTIRPVVSREDALARTSEKAGVGARATLSLVPCIAFSYDAHVESEHLPEPMTGSGAVLVNAVTGKVSEVPALLFTPSVPEIGEQSEARLAAVDVYDKVKGHLLKRFTKEVKVEREIGGVDVFENVKLSPGIDDLGLDHKGIVFAPVWKVQGAGGTVLLDAVTGLLAA